MMLLTLLLKMTISCFFTAKRASMISRATSTSCQCVMLCHMTFDSRPEPPATATFTILGFQENGILDFGNFCGCIDAVMVKARCIIYSLESIFYNCESIVT